MSKRKTYSAPFKFQLVLECLNGTRSEAEIARSYEVHPITLAKWKKHFLEHGSEVFGGKEEVKRSEQRQARESRGLGEIGHRPSAIGTWELGNVVGSLGTSFLKTRKRFPNRRQWGIPNGEKTL